jgi:hypothetical protein
VEDDVYERMEAPAAMSANGTSRHEAALWNLVAIGGKADIGQAAPIRLD